MYQLYAQQICGCFCLTMDGNHECGNRDKHLGQVNVDTSDENLCEIYKNWAPSYNEDIELEVKYVGHLSMANNLEKLIEIDVRPTKRVIDIGAGTGLAGFTLNARGFTDVDAVDLCAEMLTEAAKLGVYKNLFQKNINMEIDLPEKYDIAVSTGLFTLGHVTAKSLPNILQLLKPNGLLVFTVRSDIMEDEGLRKFYGFPEFVEELEKECKIKVLEKNDDMPYHVLPGKMGKLLHCTIYVCEKLG